MARGRYPKGERSRELILDTALEVVSGRGLDSAPLREIATRVGLSHGALLHHFGSRENLFTEVLRRRDAVDRLHDDADAHHDAERYPRLVRLARHNVEVPGLVQLYVGLAAEAADPAHASRPYFVQRRREIAANLVADVRRRQEAGRFDPNVDPERVADIMIAASDGLQAEWVVDPTIDLPGTLEYLWDRLAGATTVV